MPRFSLLLFLFLSNLISSQNKEFTVKFITSPIFLDGILDEQPWIETETATDFWQYFPSDTIRARQQTEIKMLFDNDNLYVGMKVNSPGKNYVIPSLRRDFRAGGSDNITLMFDTFNDGTNAIIFGTNPFGVQREMLLSGGGANVNDFNGAWDTKWQSETKLYGSYYTVEWIIPLSAFKYREGETKWRFNSYHFDTQDNENNTWINIPQNQNIYNLAYMGNMIFERPLGKSKSPISLIPYVSGSVGKDYEFSEDLSDLNIGGDAKMTIGNSLNLDLTVNPDFSQVEADQQVTNLTRFEISLPERRQFFIENSDLFGDFGNTDDANPFFSRRIGIARDTTGTYIENNIVAGVRLSGKVNNNLRIGILNVQTAKDDRNEIASTNNAVFTAQYKMFSRSNLSFMLINRQPTKEHDFLEEKDQYNRIIGVDYRLASEDNTWIGKYYFHKSFSPNLNDNEVSAGANTEFNSLNYNLRLGGLFIGESFRSDLGFVRRTDILKIGPTVTRTFWPKKASKINKSSISFSPIYVWRPSLNYEKSDHIIRVGWETQFLNTTEVGFRINNEYIKLYEDFNPTGNREGYPLPVKSDYNFTFYRLSFTSDRRKILSFRIEPSYGKFFNGKKWSFESSVDYRFQPYFAGSLQLNYDNIDLPNPFSDAQIWLLGSKLDFTFTKNLFWATFIQYSTQSENFSINTRLQWRFAPLSDLFIVYNDFYYTDPRLAPRLKSLNLKLTYWLNI